MGDSGVKVIAVGVLLAVIVIVALVTGAQAREARNLIAGYPRDERRDLHRYQDQIDHDSRQAGKSRESDDTKARRS